MMLLDDLVLKGGEYYSIEDCNNITDTFHCSSETIELLQKYPLVGLRFCMSEEDDLSKLGIEMKWMNIGEIIDEATQAYPGIFLRDKYIPIGICLEGTGDYYYFCIKSGNLVRVPHDNDYESNYDDSMIEIVSESIPCFLEHARIQ